MFFLLYTPTYTLYAQYKSVFYTISLSCFGTLMDVFDMNSRLVWAAATVLAPSLTILLNISIKFVFIPTDGKFA